MIKFTCNLKKENKSAPLMRKVYAEAISLIDQYV